MASKVSSVEKWFAEKRRSGGSTASTDLGMAPSPMERYGFRAPAQSNGADVRGGMLPSGAAMATGYGDDGKLQRTMPTQIRQTQGGQPYAVDEGEVVVVDANTVQRYGGAGALDSFIRQNAPKRMDSPSQPYSRGGVAAPGGQQARVAEQVAQGGVKQYYTGGIPERFASRNTGLPSSTTGSTRPAAGANTQVTPGYGAQITLPTNQGGSTTVPFNGNTPTPSGADTLNSFRTRGPSVGGNSSLFDRSGLQTFDRTRFPTPDPRSRFLRPRQPVSTESGAMTFNPSPVSGTVIQPDVATTFNPSPVQGTEINVQPAGPVVTQEFNPRPVEITPQDMVQTAPEGAPVYKPNEIDQAILNYYSTRTGAAQEAERASEAQSLQQQGLTPEAQRGIVAQSDISRRDAMANQTAQMGIGALQKAEERRRYESEQGLARQQDMRDQVRFETEQRNAAETDFTGYVQARMAADPNYDWTKDPNAVSKAQTVWDSQPGNKGKPMDNAAMTGIVKAATVTPGDAWLVTQKNSQWYKDITDPAQRANVDKALSRFSGAFSMGGVTMDIDQTTGVIKFRDLTGKTMATMDPATGDVTWGGTGTGGTGGDGDEGYSPTFSGTVTNDSDVQAFADSFSTNSMPDTEVTVDAMREYLQTHNNNGPANADAWDEWCREDRTYSISDEDDLDAAWDVISIDDDVRNATKDGVALYLAMNDGKLGTSAEMNTFFTKYGSWTSVTDSISSGQPLSPAGARLYGLSQNATKLIQDYDNGFLTDPDVLANRLRAAGLPSIDAARAVADQYDAAITNAPQATSLGSDTFASGNENHFGTAYTFAWVNPSADLTQWVNQNAGSVITVNGNQYIVSGEISETYVQVGHNGDGDSVGVAVPAVKVFNVKSGSYEYYYPVVYNEGGNSDTGTDNITLSTTEYRVGPRTPNPGQA